MHIEKLAGLGEKFDRAVSTYTPALKLSLNFALSMVFDFDMYVSDGLNFAGGTAFKNKDAADAALMKLTEQAGIIMTAQGALAEATLKRYCKSGIWLHEGRAEWFDDIQDAIEAHKASLPPASPKDAVSPAVPPVPERAQRIIARIKLLQNSFRILGASLQGAPATVSEKQSAPLIQVFEKKHFWLQNNDIPKHIEKADEEGDFEGFY